MTSPFALWKKKVETLKIFQQTKRVQNTLIYILLNTVNKFSRDTDFYVGLD